jgi:hypothetical protein
VGIDAPVFSLMLFDAGMVVVIDKADNAAVHWRSRHGLLSVRP